jgi:hypothetical protein
MIIDKVKFAIEAFDMKDEYYSDIICGDEPPSEKDRIAMDFPAAIKWEEMGDVDIYRPGIIRVSVWR